MDEWLAALRNRFGDIPDPPAQAPEATDTVTGIARHRSFRSFTETPVDLSLVKLLAATALSAPSKSDLQQCDIIIVRDDETRAKLHAVVPGQDWVPKAPELLVFCGNNRRLRQIHAWRGHTFANDHLDAFFNPAVEAGIVMQAFIVAAESVGLGTCPISGLRNNAQAVSDALALPDHVFPMAGLGVGWPAWEGMMSPRLPLAATVHVDRFDDTDIETHIDAYDARRQKLKPLKSPRDPERFGEAVPYTWSEDKARQYAAPERADFGAFVRRKGFKLD